MAPPSASRSYYVKFPFAHALRPSELSALVCFYYYCRQMNMVRPAVAHAIVASASEDHGVLHTCKVSTTGVWATWDLHRAPPERGPSRASPDQNTSAPLYLGHLTTIRDIWQTLLYDGIAQAGVISCPCTLTLLNHHGGFSQLVWWFHACSCYVVYYERPSSSSRARERAAHKVPSSPQVLAGTSALPRPLRTTPQSRPGTCWGSTLVVTCK